LYICFLVEADKDVGGSKRVSFHAVRLKVDRSSALPPLLALERRLKHAHENVGIASVRRDGAWR
jgi:hypothetical protein